MIIDILTRDWKLPHDVINPPVFCIGAVISGQSEARFALNMAETVRTVKICGAPDGSSGILWSSMPFDMMRHGPGYCVH